MARPLLRLPQELDVPQLRHLLPAVGAQLVGVVAPLLQAPRVRRCGAVHGDVAAGVARDLHGRRDSVARHGVAWHEALLAARHEGHAEHLPGAPGS